MTDHAFIVRLTWTEPGPVDHNHGAPITRTRTQAEPTHNAAHATARRWATTDLPPGTNHTLTIEIRTPTGTRTEPWRIGSHRSEAAEHLEARRTGHQPDDRTPEHLANIRHQLAAARRPGEPRP